MQQKLKKKFSDREILTIEDFLLTNDFSQKAFASLSKKTNTITKEDLLDETKRLLQEHIIKQIKAQQINLKKHRHKKFITS